MITVTNPSDTYVDPALPSSSLHTSSFLRIGPQQSLIRFRSDLVRVPGYRAATLYVRHTGGFCRVACRRMLVGWDVRTTWNQMGNGVSAGQKDSVKEDTTQMSSPGWYTFDVSRSLGFWQSPLSSMLGWVFESENGSCTFAANESYLTIDSYCPGDANKDGIFNQADIVQVLQAGKYLTGQPATWEEGDWDGNGVFDQLDIVKALQECQYQPGAQNSINAFGETWF